MCAERRRSLPSARRLACLLAGGALLGGCSLMKEVDSNVDADLAHIEEMRAQLREGASSTAVLVRSRYKIAGEEIQLKEKEKLPDVFARRISYVTSGQTLSEVLTAVSRQIAIPIWLTEFASDGAAGGGTGSAYNARSDGGEGRTPIQLQYEGTLHGLLDQLAQTSKLHWRYNEGRVEFFLYETRHFYVNLPMGSRTVSSRISGAGGGRSYDNGTGDGTSPINPSRTSANSTGDISINAGDLTINPYNALTRTITAMLMEDDGRAEIIGTGTGSTSYGNNLDTGVDGAVQSQEVREQQNRYGSSLYNREERSRTGRSRVVVTPEMAMITVTAPPTSLDRIEQYIERVNQRFSRNVMIDVKIYDVSLNDQASTGFSAALLYKNLGKYGVQVAGGTMGILGASEADQAALAQRLASAQAIESLVPVLDPLTGQPVLDPATGQPLRELVTTPGVTSPLPSRFTGSEAMIRALSSFGRVSSVTSGSVMAVNGQPAPLQVATEVTYLERTQTTTTPGSAGSNPVVTTELVPGSVVVGLTANFLPQVLGDNRILLQYQLTNSSLNGITTISSTDGTSIQTPTVSSQSLQQQAFVRDGEAIVVFGLEQDMNSRTGSRGVPLDVSREAGKSKTMRVIMLQVFGGGSNANW